MVFFINWQTVQYQYTDKLQYEVIVRCMHLVVPLEDSV